MSAQQTAERAALIELVAVKQMREEVSRRRQRRENSPFSNPAGAKAVKLMHAECKVREYRAWNVARAVIGGAALLALTACGGADDEEPRDRISPPNCTASESCT